KQILARKEFDELTQTLFLDEIGTEQINLHYLLKDPSAYGITGAEYLYAPVTLEFLEENREDRMELTSRLETIETSLLTNDQKITMRVLQSFLRTESLSDGLELYYQPLATTIGVQAQLPILLSEYAFYRKQDINDYLKLLDGIDEHYQQIMEFEKQKAEAGLMMNDTSIDHVIESCESYLLKPGDNFMIETFNSRLEEVPGLTEEEKEAYRQQNSELLDTAFLTAYKTMIEELKGLKGTGINEQGLCGYPDGKKYYRYLVYSLTGTSYASIPDLLKAIESQLLDSLTETSELLKNHPELAKQCESYHYRQTEPEAIMEELKTLTQSDFPLLPACNYTFKAVPAALELSLSPAFYLVSPLDDPRNNVIYINHNPRFSDNQLYNVIAHEGYPGHLYQNVYFHTSCESDLRKLISYQGYSEGWATYVEQLSYTLDNGLGPELGRLLAANASASLGLHACLDIYVNYMGWDKEKVKTYLENFYSDPDSVADDIFYAMVENPGNYLSYYVGYLEFLNMRKTAEAQLGNRFDAKEFHTFLLDMGNAPFDVIQSYFTSWLMKQKT
ncbi:MAG: DUF885 domain-containing protein, partial [Lachnospiraceae bacterium]|nr:DUF885 domain-containing protein [Lachnospiraceae bacterium]